MYFVVHLLKKTQLNICYTINGKLKINCDPDHGQVSAVINHVRTFQKYLVLRR